MDGRASPTARSLVRPTDERRSVRLWTRRHGTERVTSEMTTGTSGLATLLETEAARFTLQSPDDTAPTGVVEIESLREPKPLGVGIYVKHLATGEEAAVRPDVVFEAQSVIKLALAIRSYQLADDGRLDLGERVPVTRSDCAVGTGVLQYFQEGL